MKIRISAPPFCDHSRISDSGYIELEDGANLNDLYKYLAMPLILRPLLITSVNYERRRPGYGLNEGDDVSIFWPISGG